MNPAPISPGWALVAIFLLWGLAGAACCGDSSWTLPS